MMVNLANVRAGDYWMVKDERWTVTKVEFIDRSTEQWVITCTKPDGSYGEIVITAWSPRG